MGRKVVLKSSSCTHQQQDKLLTELVRVKGFGKVMVAFPQFTVTGNFKTEDLVKAAEKSGISSIIVVSDEEFPPKEKAKEEKPKDEKAKASTAIVSASAAPVVQKSVTGTIPWPLPNPGSGANYYVYVENLNLKTSQ